MASINIDLDFFDHPKVKRLIGRLGRGAEVLPIRLWCYCGKYHCEDGRLEGYTAAEIEQLIGWWGKEGECVTGMDGLFLHTIDGGFLVHDWLEYQGHIAAYKSRSKKGNAAKWAIISGKESGKESHKESGKDSFKESPCIALHGIAVHGSDQPDKMAVPKRGWKHDPDIPFACVPVPVELKSAAFDAAWREWHQARAEAGEPVTTAQARELLNRMTPWGTARAVAAIKFSIAGGYKQVCEDRKQSDAVVAPQKYRTVQDALNER